MSQKYNYADYDGIYGFHQRTRKELKAVALRLHCPPFKKLSVDDIVSCLQWMREHKDSMEFTLTLEPVSSPHSAKDQLFMRSLTERLRTSKARGDNLEAANKQLQQRHDQDKTRIFTLQQTLYRERAQHVDAMQTAQDRLCNLETQHNVNVYSLQNTVQESQCMLPTQYLYVCCYLFHAAQAVNALFFYCF